MFSLTNICPVELNAELTRLRNKNSIISNVTTIDRLHLTEDKSADIQHELKARHNIVPDFNQLANFISQPLPTKIPLQRNKYQQLLTRYSLSNMVMEQLRSKNLSAYTITGFLLHMTRSVVRGCTIP